MSRPVISSAFATQATSSQFSAVVGGLPLMKVISVFFFTIRRSSVSVITLSSGFSTFSWNSSLASRSPPEQEVRATPAATAAPEASAVRRVIARMGIVLSGSGRAAERDPFSRVLNACLLAAVEGGLLRLHEVGEQIGRAACRERVQVGAGVIG